MGSCSKCEEPSRGVRLEAPGAGCECLMCPACLEDARNACPECGALAVFCYECDTGDQEGTEPLCPPCYAMKISIQTEGPGTPESPFPIREGMIGAYPTAPRESTEQQRKDAVPAHRTDAFKSGDFDPFLHVVDYGHDWMQIPYKKKEEEEEMLHRASKKARVEKKKE